MEKFDFKKSLGQNFLVDENIKNKIVNASSVKNGSIVIEVGPGNGAITKKLVNFNVPVIAFEIDTRLKSELDKINSDNLTVYYEDFLNSDVNKVLSIYEYKRIHLIANLPYYITTSIINKVMSELDVYEMIVMVQKEVGDRFKAKPGSKDYNSLSVFLQYYYDIEKVCLVSKNCFIPVPKVDSIVVKFTKKDNLLYVKNEEEFFKFVKSSFKMKRKNLRNNLRDYDLLKVCNALNDIGKDLTYRAEQLSIEDFVYVFNKISD